MDLILNLFSFFLSIGGFIAGGIAILFVLMAIFSTSDPNEMEGCVRQIIDNFYMLISNPKGI